MTYPELWRRLLPLYDEGEAKAIIRMVLDVGFGLSLADVYAGKVTQLSQDDDHRLRKIMDKLVQGVPVQYVLGRADFAGRTFDVAQGVLIPRPETEELCAWIVQSCSHLPACGPSPTLLDVGTGSGCIAASILLERPRAFGFLAERNPQALSCAWRNLQRLGLLGRALLIHSRTPGDLPVGAECDLVVSNPPYISTEAVGGLMRDVRDFEPRMALDGGADGMDCYRALFGAAPLWLRPGGLLLLEMGDAHQAERMKGHSSRFDFLRSVLDFSAIPRCMAWRYRG